MNAPKPPQPPLPIFAMIFISMFGFIGLGLFIFLWFGTERGFPPLIFKLFGSCIAIAFMAMGFGVPITALKGRNILDEDGEQKSSSAGDAPPVKGYKCPNCGAGLGNQEVSPSGDVKCTYCHKWWNIHTAGR